MRRATGVTQGGVDLAYRRGVRATEASAALERRVREGESLLIVGDAGVGKSHLADRIARSVESAGWRSIRVSGSPALASIRFGAVEHLIGPGARSPDDVLERARAQIDRPASEPALLLVDDIDQLDLGSLAVVQHLRSADIAVVATVRTDHAGDSSVLPFWKDGLLARVDVAAHPDDTAELAERFCGLPLDAAALESVARFTLGNPLYVRELLLSAEFAGSLERRDSEMVLCGELTAERRITDLFANRLDHVGEDEREAARLIAATEPLSITTAAALIDDTVLENCESLGLAQSLALGDRITIRSGHPLLGETVRATMPPLQLRRHRRMAADVIFDSKDPGSLEMVQAVVWTLDEGENPPIQAAVGAARAALATFDGPTARRCLASVEVADAEVKTLAGRAELLSGAPDRARALLEEAVIGASTDAHRADATATLADVLMVGFGEPHKALAVLDEGLAAVDDVAAHARLASARMLGSALLGDFTPSLELGLPLAHDARLDDPARLSVLVMTTLAQSATGHIGTFDADLATGFELAERYQIDFPLAHDQLLVVQVQNDLSMGRFGTADDRIRRRVASLGGTAALTPLLQILGTVAALGRGDGAGAVELIDAATTGNDVDPLGLFPYAWVTASLVHAATGDAELSRHYEGLAVADPRTGARERTALGRARAARRAFRGDLDGAIEECLEAAPEAGDNLVWALGLLHDAARFGRGSDVLPAVERFLHLQPLDFCGLQLFHIEAQASDNAADLRSIGSRFVAMGAMMFAAEAFAQASMVEADEAVAARDNARAWSLFSCSNGLRSTAMEATPPVLTPREAEVGTLIAAGVSTPDAAERLFLSNRTVENHLQRIYGKLALNQRSDLAMVFSVPSDAP